MEDLVLIAAVLVVGMLLGFVLGYNIAPGEGKQGCLRHGPFDPIRKLFSVIDEDGNGVITQQELQAFLLERASELDLDNEMTDTEMHLFYSLDENHDQELT
eukprot:CAMPEP_0205828062 /NCGR_PEP_ID=MMETSP0206-20130828/33994_1 /ASSEMBLY_ACC=CAM_ASM_000279 /TAXON_ID=36767 /ORGANISM="Euplotes focardii, Strain TN1" /LENGTH=100 /DNA_ID=CAMNT_0053129523 /DNA_START=33 /DNA_END=331 /DNA_ORIENTATION=+